ncbi:alpha-galactosidase [Actinomycetes bacterium KLBMP 9797]
MEPTEEVIRWGHGALEVVLGIAGDAPVRLLGVSDQPDTACRADGPPLVEIMTAATGRSPSSLRYCETEVGRRLRYVGHHGSRDGAWHRLRLDLADPVTGLAVQVTLESADGVPALRSRTRVRNASDEPVVLLAVTSLSVGAFAPADETELLWAESDWLAEGRWHRTPVRAAGLADLNLGAHGQDPRGRVTATSHGTWSSGSRLPTGGLSTKDRVWLWQVEHNGAWHWEVGERRDGVSVAVLGPTDIEHQWRTELAPGQEFASVPASMAVSTVGWEDAVAHLTAHRRASRRPHPDHERLPVVFNDYMNTVMGDPTTARLLPLIDAAAGVGAEVFMVDAGWYDETGHWWDSVGEWQPSTTRFPGGLGEVLDHIRGAGLVPGLWLEPEVVGVRSPVADALPADAFFQRAGRRVVEHGRYHLDLRHPAAVAHLDAVVDRLVGDHGVGYFKLDYNINPGPGTDVAAAAAGEGLLGHNRAHLRWLEAVLDRHPDLVLENCGSGAMRMDNALLSVLQLQSTSDQQDPVRYPPIAAAAPMSVTPEQTGNWAYPQPSMTDEEIGFTMVTGSLGRLYLSGNLDRMTADQRSLVADGVRVHRSIRHDLARAVPFWPLGLPGWADPWVALGLRTGDVGYLALWRRPGAAASVSLPLPSSTGRVETLYPAGLPAWSHSWAGGVLDVRAAGDAPAARLFRLTWEAS